MAEAEANKQNILIQRFENTWIIRRIVITIRNLRSTLPSSREAARFRHVEKQLCLIFLEKLFFKSKVLNKNVHSIFISMLLLVRMWCFIFIFCKND